MANLNKKHRIYYFFLALLATAGCATKSAYTPPERKSSESYNINKAVNLNEVYVIFSKDDKGIPTGIHQIEKSERSAVDFFRQDEKSIKKYDCIRFLSKNGVNSSSVCNETMWFHFGKFNHTRLTSRKAKHPVDVVTHGALATAFSPLVVVADVLSLDPELKATRSHMLTAVSDPVQDHDELATARASVEVLFDNHIQQETRASLGSIEKTIAFIEKYPGLPNSKLLDAALKSAIQSGNDQKVFQALKNLPLNKDQKSLGLSFLRKQNNFSGYIKSFDISNSVEDAKKAQSHAATTNDKKTIEYMAIKMLKLKNVPLDSIFKLSVKEPLTAGKLKAERDTGVFFITESANSGTADYKMAILLSGEKSLGIFKHGSYDVEFTCILSVPQRLYRRSNWLGNEDTTKVKKIEEKIHAKLYPPNYTSTHTVQFNNVELNYKDRGIAGGTTEITLNGKPFVNCGVKDVEPIY